MPQGGSNAPNRLFRAYSLKLIGALRQHELGLSVETLTGCNDAIARAKFFLADASRHQNPLNYVLWRWLKLWIQAELQKPEWAPLRRFFDQGRNEYLRRKAEQVAIIEREMKALRLNGR